MYKPILNNTAKKTHNDEDDGDDYATAQAFTVMGKPSAMMYEVNVDEAFSHPRQFSQIVHILENASEEDWMTINLSTPGGRLDSVLPILGAIDATQAHVHVHAMSDVASAGTFLLMKAHSVSLNDYVTVMCHNVSYGVSNDGHSVETYVAHTAKSSKKILRDMYEDFFSTKEIDSMLTGTPIYMDKEQFIEHYEERDARTEKKIADAMRTALKGDTTPRKPRAKKVKETVDVM